MSEHKEIRRYYNFDYLLRPASKPTEEEQNSFCKKVGRTETKKVMVRSLVCALTMSNELMWLATDGKIKYTNIEKNMDKSIFGLMNAPYSSLVSDIIVSASKDVLAATIYNYLLSFEVDMKRRGCYSEPVRNTPYGNGA